MAEAKLDLRLGEVCGRSEGSSCSKSSRSMDTNSTRGRGEELHTDVPLPSPDASPGEGGTTEGWTGEEQAVEEMEPRAAGAKGGAGSPAAESQEKPRTTEGREVRGGKEGAPGRRRRAR